MDNLPFIRKSLVKNAIALIYIVLMAWTMLLLLFLSGVTDYYLKTDIGISNPLIIILSLPGLVIAYSFYKLVSYAVQNAGTITLTHKTEFIIMLCLSLMLFITEVLFSTGAFFYSDWDPAAILDCTYKVLNGRQGEVSLDYFSAHPNNLMLVFIYVTILRIAKTLGTESVLSLVIFQSFLFTAAGLIFYSIVREIFSFKEALLLWIVYALWIGLNPWLIITYSDAVGLIFPLITLKLSQLIFETRAGGIYTCLMGFAAAIGYLIKPQTVIIFIAVMLVFLIKVLSDMERTYLLRLVIILPCFFLMLLIARELAYPSLGLELNEKKAFGFSHYLMMGLNPDTDGVYSNDDTEFTNSIDDPGERQAENLRIAGERLKAYSLKGFLGHLNRKQLINFNDGSFSWGIDGDFFAGTEFAAMPSVPDTSVFRPFILSLIMPDGENHVFFRKAQQAIWITVLFLSLMAGGYPRMRKIPGWQKYIQGDEKENKRDEIWTDTFYTLALSITGLILFELIFEAKARYLFTYLPLFIIMAAYGTKMAEYMLIKVVENPGT